MEFFKTNASLGHNQYAILLRISQSEYLVIDRINISSDYYPLGELEIFETSEHFYLEPIQYDINKSPLNDKFLFKSFIKTLDI